MVCCWKSVLYNSIELVCLDECSLRAQENLLELGLSLDSPKDVSKLCIALHDWKPVVTS